MKRQFTSILGSIFLLTSLNACNKDNINGPIVQEERALAPFTQINSEISGDVILVQNDIQKITVQAQENIIDDIRTEVVGGQLNIYLKNRPRLTTGKGFKVYITVPKVNRLVLNGSGDIEAQNEITLAENMELVLKGSGNFDLPKLVCEDLYAELIGSGKINIDGGIVDEMHLKLKGSGNFNAAQLATNKAWINLTGSGNATVRVTENLYATISGSGNIYYYGNPIVTENISGSGKIKRKS